MEYDSLTDQVNTAVSSGISAGTSWNAVPGGLDKVSASAKGFAWGMGSGNIWLCQLPCEGNWKQIAPPSQSTVRDIITDDSHVYVLLQNQLAMKSSDNTDEWIAVNLTDSIEKIISTASYIWGQAGQKKYKLPKPGMTGNWIPVDDKLNVKITSASAGHLYGVDAAGQAMMTDEALQTSWSVIPQFGGKYTAIIGDADQTAIFGIDDTNSLKRCLNGKCKGVDTQGYTPQNITIDPSAKELWMTTAAPGKSGNVFTMPVTSDYSDLLKKVKPLDEQRDQLVREEEVKQGEATHAEILTKQYEYLQNLIRQIFDIKPVSSHQKDAESVQDDIDNAKNSIFLLNGILPFIQKMVFVLFLIMCVYAASDYIGSFTHAVALAILISGTYFFTIYK
jgi:hypothetical protein